MILKGDAMSVKEELKKRVNRIYHANLHYAASARAAELESDRYYDFKRAKRKITYLSLYALALHFLFFKMPQLLVAPVIFAAIAIPLFAVFFIATKEDADTWRRIKWFCTIVGITAYVFLRGAAPDSFLYKIFSGSLVQGIAIAIDVLVLLYLITINYSLIKQGIKARIFDANQEGLSEFVEFRDLLLIYCFTSFSVALTLILFLSPASFFPQYIAAAFDLSTAQPLFDFYWTYVYHIVATIVISLGVIYSIKLGEIPFDEQPKVFEFFKANDISNTISPYELFITITAGIVFTAQSMWHWFCVLAKNMALAARDTATEMFNVYTQLLFTWIIGTVLPPLLMVGACTLLYYLSDELAAYLQQPYNIFVIADLLPAAGSVVWSYIMFTAGLIITAIAMALSRVHVRYNRFFQMLIVPKQVKMELRAALYPAQSIWSLSVIALFFQLLFFTSFQFTQTNFVIGHFVGSFILVAFLMFLYRNSDSLKLFNETIDNAKARHSGQPKYADMTGSARKERAGDSGQKTSCEDRPQSPIEVEDVSGVDATPLFATTIPPATNERVS